MSQMKKNVFCWCLIVCDTEQEMRMENGKIHKHFNYTHWILFADSVTFARKHRGKQKTNLGMSGHKTEEKYRQCHVTWGTHTQTHTKPTTGKIYWTNVQVIIVAENVYPDLYCDPPTLKSSKPICSKWKKKEVKTQQNVHNITNCVFQTS